jgi:DNA-binding Lrp family transcriptional regulator
MNSNPSAPTPPRRTTLELSEFDRALIRATQAGLPLDIEPYARLAEELNASEALIHERLRVMLDAGVIRRIAAVPNHYRLGFVANGMTVWDLDDAAVPALGRRLGALPYVTHCYSRPRHPGIWPYNVFAMVHAQSRDEVRRYAADMAAMLGSAVRAHDVLFSKRILKKTGFRLGGVPN